MLNYNTLGYKPSIKLRQDDKELEECIDLLVNTVSQTYEPYMSDVCVVNKYYVARPDLISLAFYGTDQFGDVICKVNGISNPFELNEGMIIDIPSRSSIDELYKGHQQAASEQIMSDSTIRAKQSDHQKLASEYRSPAQQLVGDSNFVIDRSLGLVIY